MVKKMFVKNGSSFMLVDLVIDEQELYLCKELVDYYPVWSTFDSYKSDLISFEGYAKEHNIDLEKNIWIISKILNNILYEDEPLIISDSINKLCRYVPKNNIESYFVEEIFRRLSYKMENIKLNNNSCMMNMVALKNYCNDSKEYNDIVDGMIEDEKEFLGKLSKKKEKKLRSNINNSIPRKSIIF